MKNREARHRKIQDLIAEFRIESQEDLREKLQAVGFDVTQATLSRDLRYLQVGKQSDGGDGYHYVVKEREEASVGDLLRGWISIAFSGNLGVIKTLPGHANSVAIAIDMLEFDELLGTVAGDDTILLVLKEAVSSSGFLASLSSAVPGIEEIDEGITVNRTSKKREDRQ